MVMQNPHDCMLSLHNSALSMLCKIFQAPNSLLWKNLQFFDNARQRSLVIYCWPFGGRVNKPMRVPDWIFQILNEACQMLVVRKQMLDLLHHQNLLQ
jgi:hypothetical protein